MPSSNPRIPCRLASDAPAMPPPDDKLIVHIVLNLEHWPFDQPMPRALFDAPYNRIPWPDLANFSWVEHGLRLGVPRLVRVLKERGLRASATMNVSVIDVYPRCAETALGEDREIIGHAIVRRPLQLEKNEVEVVHLTAERLKKITGKRLLAGLVSWISACILFENCALAQRDAPQAYSEKRGGAETFPTKPVRLIVPAAPGGGSDILARVIGQKMTESFRQQVVVDNRPGAGNIIGTNIAAKSAPDGHTLVMVATTHAINVSLVGKLPFDSIRDFAPVILCASAPYLLAVHPSLAVKSVKELIALARSKPGQLNYGQGGNGTPPHLAAELFKSMAKLDIAGIPYNGGGLAIAATLSGEVHLTFGVIPVAAPLVRAGRLTGLGVTSLERSTLTPELPTIAEAGVPGYEAIAWYGVLAPARTEPAIVNKLDQEIKRVLQLPDVKERLAGLGFEPIPTTPQKFAAYIESEIPKWAKIVKAANVRLD